MGTNPHPRGTFLFGSLPFQGFGAGIHTPYGLMLPPTTRVGAYVRSGGVADGMETAIKEKLVTTLASGLKTCAAGLGNTVVILPGHSENVADATMLDNLAAGTRIIGIGRGTSMPTFRWTAAGGQWTLDQNDVVVQGLRLRLEGANGVTKAINITGTDNLICGCDIETASGATAKATIALEVGSGAVRTDIIGNRFRGTETHNSTDVIKIVGGTVPSDLTIADNYMICSATAANGLINVTVAAKRVTIMRNILYNTHTASTACIAVADVASDGVIAYNLFGTINDGTATAQGVVFAGTTDLFRCFQNFSGDEKNKSGVLTPAAVAT